MTTNQYEIIVTPTGAREISRICESKIEKVDDELMRNYRRIVIKNFVVLYTIDEEHKIVYISHMYYGKRNY